MNPKKIPLLRAITTLTLAVVGMYALTMTILDPVMSVGLIGMAVTANQLIRRQTPEKGWLPVAAATTLYQGTLCFIASGYASGTAGGNVFAGMVESYVDNSGGAAGDKNVQLWREGQIVVIGSGFTQATVGAKIYASDNFTVTTVSTSNSYIGTCVEYISATEIVVEMDCQAL